MPVAQVSAASIEHRQLPLALDPVAGEPRLPEGLRPMLARTVARLPDDGRHVYDPSWGGVRVLAYVQAGTVRLIAARGRDLTARVPEVAAGLGAALGAAGPCLLDAELVAPDASGRLDRGALAARLGRSRAAGRRRSDGGSASLLVTDCLVGKGRSLLARPLAERRDQLSRLLRPASHVIPLAPFTGSPRELLDAAGRMGLAAVLAKDPRGPYLPGVRSRLWLRVPVGRAGPASVDDGRRAPAPPRRPDLVALLRLPLE